MSAEVARAFYPEANKYFLWGCAAFVALFGLGFAYGGIDRLPHRVDLETVGKSIFGLALLFLAWRVARYGSVPTLEFTDDAVVYRPFWTRRQTWPYADIQSISQTPQVHNVMKYHAASGLFSKSKKTIQTSKMFVLMASGTEKVFTCPHFRPDRVLAAFERYAGARVDR